MAATVKPLSGKIQCDGSVLYGKTGRKFDMSVIDWKQTLSERPKQ